MELEAALRLHGHRVTYPRQVVWNILSSAGRHLNAQEITEAAQAREPTINPSSIYRTLALLTELGLARESHLGDATTWEQSHRDSVVHLVCVHCGVVRHSHAASVDRIRKDLAGESDFVAETIDVRVMGRCTTCE